MDCNKNSKSETHWGEKKQQLSLHFLFMGKLCGMEKKRNSEVRGLGAGFKLRGGVEELMRREHLGQDDSNFGNVFSSLFSGF